MANKMLIDATHPEETRVVVVRGNRVEEFDFESASRRQLRGNIYLAKVTRVEPSLQAAFVEYGGNRHGFLAFSEIHPDYYQIPVADRQALIAEEERAHREAEDEVDRRAGRRRGRGAERRRDTVRSAPVRPEAGPEASDQPEATADLAVSHEAQFTDGDAVSPAAGEETRAPDPADGSADPSTRHEAQFADAAAEDHAEQVRASAEAESPEPVLVVREAVEEQEAAQAADQADHESRLQGAAEARGAGEPAEHAAADNGDHVAREQTNGNGDDENGEEEEVVESVGGDDALEEATERLPRIRRQYKIQEVIKRRQIMLVQVVKEERGNKGAALTTYLSLAGRYCVLMPNTPRGGGISRKIVQVDDRRKLKEIAQELEVPTGMGLIIRTAGQERSKAEIKRDYEYLLRLWNEIRETTLKSVAPKLIYEEGDLIKRAMRDLYTRDIEEVLVEGDDGYRAAKRLMTMLMPSRARLVKQYREETPLFFAYRVEDQLDAMHSPTVQLPSGGSIVIHTTEALTAIDVNSGRSTRERHIDETAVKTNLEAADEVSRQLRLRDLAGLIVIDFIDMAEGRHQRSVEKRLREALKSDRARIQMGKISQFGLMELSRQRLRASLQELSSQVCPHCAGLGVVRSTESCVLQTLRAIQEAGIKGDVAVLAITAPGDVALYLLNQKREALSRLEQRYAMRVTVHIDHGLVPPAMRLEVAEKRDRERQRVEAGRADLGETSLIDEPVAEEAEDAAEPQARVEAGPKAAAQRRPAGEEGEEAGARRRRKRRRRRRRPGEVGVAPEA
ncbi:MAG: Rne/Rng family ribonuclease, partial [Xanthobacteraceae bacterium]